MDLSNLNKNRKPKRDRSTEISAIVYGKIPPQARDMEEVVLGAIMYEKSAFDRVSDLLKPECFYVHSHQSIFRAMQKLQQKNQPIDILTVVEELKNLQELDNVGGPYYVTKLTDSVVSSANIEAHAKVIVQKYLAREMIRITGETHQECFEDTGDVFMIITEHEKKITDLSSGTHKSFIPQDEALIQSVQRIEELRNKADHITGIPSGFPEIDRITHGWQNSDLIILAARPAVGKTAFALQLARNAAMNSVKTVPVGFFSLEMSIGQLNNRNLSAEAEIFLDAISCGNLDDEQMKTLYLKGIQKLAKAKIFYDDRGALNIHEFQSSCRRLKRLWLRYFGTGDGVIILDYLQLMSGTGEQRGNREQEISQISRGLKQTAKELNVPIIALSQLSRDVEKRGGEKKMPQLSDLRESGAIEQDADLVMFMYRPEYYDSNNDENGNSTKGLTEIKIAKHRNGKLETIKLKARLDIQKFYGWDGDLPFPEQSWRPISLPYKDDGDII